MSRTSSTDSKLTLELYTNNTINSIINQYPSPSPSRTNINGNFITIIFHIFLYHI